jgi:hypothetical protein
MLGPDLLGAEGVRLLLRPHHDVPGDAGEAAKAEPPVPAGRLPADPSIYRLVAFDDLVHALVAEVEFLGDLTHRAAGRVQSADRVVVVELRAIGVVLKLEQAGAKLARLVECAFV